MRYAEIGMFTIIYILTTVASNARKSHTKNIWKKESHFGEKSASKKLSSLVSTGKPKAG